MIADAEALDNISRKNFRELQAKQQQRQKQTKEPLVYKTYEPSEQQPAEKDWRKFVIAVATSVADNRIREYMGDMLPVVSDHIEDRLEAQDASTVARLRKEFLSTTATTLRSTTAARPDRSNGMTSLSPGCRLQ